MIIANGRGLSPHQPGKSAGTCGCRLARVADEQVTEPDNTAVRVALWRAMHVLVDALGLRLAAPPDGCRARPDMDPVFTSGFRGSIVARARFIEDLVAERAG